MVLFYFVLLPSFFTVILYMRRYNVIIYRMENTCLEVNISFHILQYIYTVLHI